MKKYMLGVVLAIFAGLAVSAQADTGVGQHYIDRLAIGGAGTVRDVASNIYNTQMTDQEVLDTLAEVTWQNHTRTEATWVDAISWACKALGSSRSPRYRLTLETVVEQGSHPKLKKYALQSLKQLARDDVEQYVGGTISLDELRQASVGRAAAGEAAKRWIPFNYRGADLVRKIALYEGQGRIVYAHQSQYVSTWHVIEVVVDEGERGYQ